MNPEIAKWVETAQNDVTWEGAARALWQNRLLEVYKELQRANKIIDKIVGA